MDDDYYDDEALVNGNDNNFLDDDEGEGYTALNASQFCALPDEDEYNEDPAYEEYDDEEYEDDDVSEHSENILELVSSLNPRDQDRWLQRDDVDEEEKQKFYHFTQTQQLPLSQEDDDEEEEEEEGSESEDDDEDTVDRRTLSELDESLSSQQNQNDGGVSAPSVSAADGDKKPAALPPATITNPYAKPINHRSSSLQSAASVPSFQTPATAHRTTVPAALSLPPPQLAPFDEEDDDIALYNRIEREHHETTERKKRQQELEDEEKARKAKEAVLSSIQPLRFINNPAAEVSSSSASAGSFAAENIDPQQEEPQSALKSSNGKRKSMKQEPKTEVKHKKKSKKRKSGLPPKDDNQFTLTQCFRDQKEKSKYDPFQPKQVVQEEDSSRVRYRKLRVGGGSIPYHVGDIWTSNHPKRRGMYYKIVSFMAGKASGKLADEAVCEAYIDMQHTFIGRSDEFDGRLARYPAENWVVDKDRKAKGRRIYEGGVMPLKYLNLLKIPAEEFESKLSHWIYDVTGEKLNKDFMFAYRIQIPGQPRTLRDPEFEFTVGELCSGAGGMGLGFKKAGGKVRYAVDTDQFACATLKTNFPDTQVIADSLANFAKGLKRGLYTNEGVNHIHASPPCKSFSGANRTGGKDDEKNSQVSLDQLDVISACGKHAPLTTSFENVKGMLFRKHRHYAQKIVIGMMKKNYQVKGMILDSADYGDPTQRERFFLFGAAMGMVLPDKPKPIPQSERGSVAQTLENLRDIEPEEGAAPVLINGQQVTEHNTIDTTLKAHDRDEIMKLSQMGQFAETILCNHPIKHDTLKRYITIRERARLMSFPDWFQFWGTTKAKRTQIGNAVPVGLATAVAKAIMETYK